MPRVNRDLQRRMAARRDRERRRVPADRRYRFAPPEAAGSLVEQVAPNTVEVVAAATPVVTSTSQRPFSAYRAEYAYVLSDLRRVGLVIGSLLLILILLYFVLAH